MFPTKPEPTENKRSWPAIASSFGLHFILLAILAVALSMTQNDVGGGDEADRAGQIVLATVNSDATNYESEPAESTKTDFADLNARPSELPQSLDLPQAIPDAGLDAPGPAIDVEAMGATEMTHRLNPAHSKSFEMSPEQLDQLAREQKEVAGRQRVGPPTNIALFGAEDISGSKFVFVLDRSASMGGGGLGVLPQAENELQTAVSSLSADHLFQIVAYHNQATLMSQRSMLPATEDNKKQIKSFIAELAAFGATQHEAGLYTALALQPDVIVFMTDGGYPHLNTGQIDSFYNAARRKVVLHAIQFGTLPEAPQEAFMRDLAQKFGGTYTYVDVNQWRK